MENTSVTTPSHRAYIEDGILYNEYINEFYLSAILDNEQQSLDLLNAAGIRIIPCIVVMKNIDKTGFKFPAKDYGKALSGIDLLKRISSAWVVGLSDDIKKTATFINKVFLGGRMHFVNSLEDAQKEAKASIAVSEPILEKE